MNVTYVSNEAYSQYLGAGLYSLYDNNKDEKQLNVYIISIGMQKASLKKLKATAKLFNREVNIIDFNNIKDKLGEKIKTGRFDSSIMGRVFLGELLPEKVKKVIYLDCDTIVLGSLRKLWQLALYSNIMAAVPEPTVSADIKKAAGLYRDYLYYNSGVLLINLELWRRENIKEKVLAYHKSISRACFFNDQDALNGVLAYRIKLLPPKYNFFSNYKYWNYKELVKATPKYEIITRKEYEASKVHPVILHFAGDERPWNKGCLNYYRRAYDKYAKLSMWEDKRASGKRVYMFLYHLMNLSTMFCPCLRHRLSAEYLKHIKSGKRY